MTPRDPERVTVVTEPRWEAPDGLLLVGVHSGTLHLAGSFKSSGLRKTYPRMHSRNFVIIFTAQLLPLGLHRTATVHPTNTPTESRASLHSLHAASGDA